jgi:hypothetical protein
MRLPFQKKLASAGAELTTTTVTPVRGGAADALGLGGGGVGAATAAAGGLCSAVATADAAAGAGLGATDAVGSGVAATGAAAGSACAGAGSAGGAAAGSGGAGLLSATTTGASGSGSGMDAGFLSEDQMSPAPSTAAAVNGSRQDRPRTGMLEIGASETGTSGFFA